MLHECSYFLISLRVFKFLKLFQLFALFVFSQELPVFHFSCFSTPRLMLEDFHKCLVSLTTCLYLNEFVLWSYWLWWFSLRGHIMSCWDPYTSVSISLIAFLTDPFPYRAAVLKLWSPDSDTIKNYWGSYRPVLLSRNIMQIKK